MRERRVIELQSAEYGVPLTKGLMRVKLSSVTFLNNSRLLKDVEKRGDCLVVGRGGVLFAMTGNTLVEYITQPIKAVTNAIDNPEEWVVFDEGHFKRCRPGWLFKRPLDRYFKLSDCMLIGTTKSPAKVVFDILQNGLEQHVFLIERGHKDAAIYYAINMSHPPVRDVLERAQEMIQQRSVPTRFS